MGHTIGQDIGMYDDADSKKAPDESPEPYREEGSAVDRGDMVGTLDTSTIAPGDHEDLRNLTTSFDRADEHLAQRMADSGYGDSDDERTDKEREADGLVIEGQGDRSDEEIFDALNARKEAEDETGADTRTYPEFGSPETKQVNDPLTTDPESNPGEGKPGEGQEANEDKRTEAQREADEREEAQAAAQAEQTKVAIESEALSDAQVIEQEKQGLNDGGKQDPEEVVGDESTIESVKAYAEDHPDQIGDLIKAEKKNKNRSGLLDWLEKNKPFDPSEHSVTDTKAHFDKADDEEVERVKAEERKGQSRPGIVNWTRET